MFHTSRLGLTHVSDPLELWKPKPALSVPPGVLSEEPSATHAGFAGAQALHRPPAAIQQQWSMEPGPLSSKEQAVVIQVYVNGSFLSGWAKFGSTS